MPARSRIGRPRPSIVDAGLGGELRSASWFASRDGRDDWADLHLERAAARLNGIDWAQLYPTVRAPRARLASVMMVAGALALTFGLPQRASARRPTGTTSSPTAKAAAPGALQPDGILLPPELMAQLQALLDAAQKGDAVAAERLASNEELRELLNKLAQDPELLAKLAKALAAADPLKGPTARELKELAERARRAAETAAMSQDMREALEKMADEAESAEAQESASNEEGRPMSSDGPQEGESGQSNAASSMQELSVQMARQADAGGGAGIMMMSNPGEKGSGPPGSGVGGSGSDETSRRLRPRWPRRSSRKWSKRARTTPATTSTPKSGASPSRAARRSASRTAPPASSTRAAPPRRRRCPKPAATACRAISFGSPSSGSLTSPRARHLEAHSV